MIENYIKIEVDRFVNKTYLSIENSLTYARDKILVSGIFLWKKEPHEVVQTYIAHAF